jgi:hypothetical protein
MDCVLFSYMLMAIGISLIRTVGVNLMENVVDGAGIHSFLAWNPPPSRHFPDVESIIMAKRYQDKGQRS